MAPMSMEELDKDSRRTVCVMDAGSTLGSALVDELLSRDYNVHAATYKRSGDHQLKGGFSATDGMRVKVFRADPFDYQTIVDAVKGCSGLFYTFEQSTYDELMVEVEVRAAHNVLEACAQTDSIERVVFTSSVTAVIWKENRNSVVDFDERDWSDPNFCQKFKLWQGLAKTLAERTAWALAMDRGVDMVSVNAGLLLAGPGLSLAHPYLKGAPEMHKDGVLVTVDLRFLTDAHITAFESSAAYGRYLCFNNTVCRPEDALKLAITLSPSVTQTPPSDELGIIQQRIQNKKLKNLMLEYAEEMKIEA